MLVNISPFSSESATKKQQENFNTAFGFKPADGTRILKTLEALSKEKVVNTQHLDTILGFLKSADADTVAAYARKAVAKANATVFKALEKAKTLTVVVNNLKKIKSTGIVVSSKPVSGSGSGSSGLNIDLSKLNNLDSYFKTVLNRGDGVPRSSKTSKIINTDLGAPIGSKTLYASNTQYEAIVIRPSPKAPTFVISNNPIGGVSYPKSGKIFVYLDSGRQLPIEDNDDFVALPVPESAQTFRTLDQVRSYISSNKETHSYKTFKQCLDVISREGDDDRPNSPKAHAAFQKVFGVKPKSGAEVRVAGEDPRVFGKQAAEGIIHWTPKGTAIIMPVKSAMGKALNAPQDTKTFVVFKDKPNNEDAFEGSPKPIKGTVKFLPFEEAKQYFIGIL